MILPFKRLSSTAKAPSKAYDRDACYDLFADHDATVCVGEVTAIDTGIAMAIPEGYGGLLMGRSGMGKKGVRPLGFIMRHGHGIERMGGVIDEYRGPLILLVSAIGNPVENYAIKRGDAIAQIWILPVPETELHDVGAGELPPSERGNKGFGSSDWRNWRHTDFSIPVPFEAEYYGAGVASYDDWIASDPERMRVFLEWLSVQKRRARPLIVGSYPENLPIGATHRTTITRTGDEITVREDYQAPLPPSPVNFDHNEACNSPDGTDDKGYHADHAVETKPSRPKRNLIMDGAGWGKGDAWSDGVNLYPDPHTDVPLPGLFRGVNSIPPGAILLGSQVNAEPWNSWGFVPAEVESTRRDVAYHGTPLQDDTGDSQEPKPEAVEGHTDSDPSEPKGCTTDDPGDSGDTSEDHVFYRINVGGNPTISIEEESLILLIERASAKCVDKILSNSHPKWRRDATRIINETFLKWFKLD